MPTYTDDFLDLVDAQVESEQYPTLKSVTLAQWILESGRGGSALARHHYNFGGLKWRDRMQGYAVPVQMATPSEPQGETWCKFQSPAAYIPGYWQFIESGPYGDPANYTDNPRAYLEMLHETGYATDPSYVDKVWSLEPEARNLLKQHGAEPPPAGRLQTKVAIVVGHNSQAPGAYSQTLGEPEYTFNERVAAIMKELAPQYHLDLEVFFRYPNRGGYSAEINECYSRVNAWDPHLCGELHFNAFNGSANGCEMWYWHSSAGGPILAQHLQDNVLAAFSLANRGIKANNGSQRGAASLRAARAYNIILEPFFGDNQPDARQFILHERLLAETYLTAYRDAAIELGLMEVIPPKPPIDPPPLDLVSATVPRETAILVYQAWGDALD